jgi:hypothetical protein
MFSLFRKDADPPTAGASTLMPRRMDLEERKAFRRDLVDQVIREGLLSFAVTSAQYRLRLMPVDARHHRFVAMLDISRDFEPRRKGQLCELEAVELEIRQSARERFGLALEGVYWRAGAARPGLDQRGPARDAPPALATAAGHRPWQLVSEEEKQALMEAIRDGGELPVLHVGDWEYQTDMMPLDEGRVPGAQPGTTGSGRVR